MDLLTYEDNVDDDVDFVIDYESIFNTAIDELQDDLVSFKSFPYIKEEEVKEHHPSEEAIEEPHPSEEESKECSICLIDFENNDDVVLLNCKHLFHYSCIVEWAHHKKDCPNCREKI